MNSAGARFAIPAALFLANAAAQKPASGVSATGPDSELARGVHLAEAGRCGEALPLLRKPLARADQNLRRTAGVARVRCAMAMNQADEAAESLHLLTREFPEDPDVLYLTVHAYSDLSMRASQQLLFKAPGSYQVHQLNAESLEMQGKWDQAAEEYRAALKKNPSAPGIHALLGRLILSKAKTSTTMEDARREFVEELKINPQNATAEFVLGEIARQGEQLPAAIEHFSRAAKLDAGFADAFLGLGRALLDSDRTGDAVAPLETAVKLQPDNPTAHFVLATAYQRSGRKDDAAREFAAHKRTSEQASRTTQEIKRGVSAGLVENVPQR
jgi:Tfp pilus assembly protein PilF